MINPELQGGSVQSLVYRPNPAHRDVLQPMHLPTGLEIGDGGVVAVLIAAALEAMPVNAATPSLSPYFLTCREP